jgi:hypothetical protein
MSNDDEKTRNWWYRQQSDAKGQTVSTIKDLDFYFCFCGGPPRPGDRFREEGTNPALGYSFVVQKVNEEKKQFTFMDKYGEKQTKWLDWMIPETQGVGKTERRPRVKGPPKPKTTKTAAATSTNKIKSTKRSS